jgi:membrane-associated HD superfamily phosphohydrolase
MKIIDLTKDYFRSLSRELAAKIPDMPALAKNVKFQRMAVLVIVAVILSFLITPEFYISHPQFKIGSIAPKDIKADKDLLVEDRASTEQKKRESIQGTKSVYDYDNALAEHLVSSVSSAFSKMRIFLKDPANEGLTGLPSPFSNKAFHGAINQFQQSLGIKLSEQELRILLQENFSESLEEKIVQLLRAVYINR